MIRQFFVYQYASQQVVVLTNTVFNDVESILIAPIKQKQNAKVVSNLQIPCRIDDSECYIDLLDIATVSKRRLDGPQADLQS